MDPENVSSFRPEESPLEDVEFEGYFNRDSTKYKLAYGIPEAETVVRGTYRYKVKACSFYRRRGGGGVIHLYHSREEGEGAWAWI